jgi:hypothetical protein
LKNFQNTEKFLANVAFEILGPVALDKLSKTLVDTQNQPADTLALAPFEDS